MKRQVSCMLAGSLIAAILLTGCSSHKDTAASSSAGSSQAQSGSNAAQPDAGGRGNGMDRFNMNIGKIKSISGSTITLYTADMPEMPAGTLQGGDEPDTAPGTGAEGGQPPEGSATPPEDRQAPEGQATPPEGMPEGGSPDGTGQGGGMRSGGMMQNFSEETTDITVGSDTTFVSVTFDNGTRQEAAISLADLQTDDIIQYTLKTDTSEAEKITLNSGNLASGGPGGIQGGADIIPGGAGDSSGSTNADDTTGSNS